MMPTSAFTGFSADAAVLLVLLPPDPGLARPAVLAALDRLQQQLGAAIQVLKIDQATHPAVVSSFHAPGLPACVLVRQGTELWRQQGLPEADELVPLLLSKVELAAVGRLT
ncbi:YbbN family protein [Hymenobacter persicinus]|uniref:thioredoxin n=1 Tax=Hymenobacter persicinus TaxID=2025506 RepID=UPI001A92FE4C|nr:thioredoxin [Hymenobacter persicinus]